MQSIQETLFLIQFLIVLGIVFGKLYNLFKAGQWYGPGIAMMGFILYWVGWFVGLSVTLLDPENLIYVVLFKFEVAFTLFMVLFSLGELMLYLGVFAQKGAKAFSSLDARKS